VNPVDKPKATTCTAYKAEVKVLLKRAILDPQGRAVETTLRRLGTDNVEGVRIGKHIELTLTGERAEVEAQLERLIEQVLSNPVLEEATYTLTESTVAGTDPQTAGNTETGPETSPEHNAG